MSAQPERRESRPVNRSFSLSFEDDRKLTEIAEAVAGGKRSTAVQWLIDRYHGLALERADQLRETAQTDRDGGLHPWSVVRLGRVRLDERTTSYVAGLVRSGQLVATACRIAGVTERQRAQWTKKGRVDRASGRESLEADWVTNIEEAEALVEAEDIRRLRQFAETNPRVLQWILERTKPETFAERKVVDKRSTVAVFPVIDWDALTTTEVRTLIALLKKASPSIDDPRVTRTQRPAAELLPPEVVEEAELVEGEIVAELPEAPLLESDSAELEASAGEPPADSRPADEKPGP